MLILNAIEQSKLKLSSGNKIVERQNDRQLDGRTDRQTEKQTDRVITMGQVCKYDNQGNIPSAHQ